MHVGNLWALITIVGAVILGCALAYGMLRNSQRNRRLDGVTEAATKAQYDPDGTSYRPTPDQANAAANSKPDSTTT